MHRINRTAAVLMAALYVLGCVMPARGDTPNKNAKRDEAFNPVEFIKRFKIGMNYSEVQEILPRNFEQDILSYVTTEDVFMLTVDIPGPGSWNASFKFDTLDTAMRRPERLVEMSCSASLEMRGESFESIVHKVTAAFGEPVKLDRSEEKFQQAGWRVSGGSVLTLEYAIMPGGPNGSASVEFIIKKNPRRDLSVSKAVA